MLCQDPVRALPKRAEVLISLLGGSRPSWMSPVSPVHRHFPRASCGKFRSTGVVKSCARSAFGIETYEFAR